jgi:hypothetical protein
VISRSTVVTSGEKKAVTQIAPAVGPGTCRHVTTVSRAELRRQGLLEIESLSLGHRKLSRRVN